MPKSYETLKDEFDRSYAKWRGARDEVAEASFALYMAELLRAEPDLAIVVFTWSDEERGFELCEATTVAGTSVSEELRALEDSDDWERASYLLELRRGLRQRNPSADWIRVDLRTMNVDSG